MALAALLAATPLAADVNRVVLRVNDEIATLADYQQRLDQRLVSIRNSDADAARRQELMNEAGTDTMRDLLEELLVVSRASQLGIAPTRAEIDSTVESTKESFGITTPEQFAAALTQSGLTPDQFREQIRNNLLIRGVVSREVQPRVEVTEDDLRRVYQENLDRFREPARFKLRGIVVLETSGLAVPELARIATEVRNQVLAGKPLEEVLPPYVEKGETTEVLDLGWVAVADLDPALAAAVEEVEVGGYTEPVAARGGIHLLQVVDRAEARIKPFEEVSEQIEAREHSVRFQQELQTYIQELQKKAYIRSDPPPEAAGFLAAEASPEGGGVAAVPLIEEPLSEPQTPAGETEQPPPSEPQTPPPGR